MVTTERITEIKEKNHPKMKERRISSIYAKIEGKTAKTLSEEFVLDEGMRLKKKELTIDLTDRGSDWGIIHYNGRFFVKCCGKGCLWRCLAATA